MTWAFRHEWWNVTPFHPSATCEFLVIYLSYVSSMYGDHYTIWSISDVLFGLHWYMAISLRGTFWNSECATSHWSDVSVSTPPWKDRGSLFKCLSCIADILYLDPLASDSTFNAENFFDWCRFETPLPASLDLSTSHFIDAFLLGAGIVRGRGCWVADALRFQYTKRLWGTTRSRSILRMLFLNFQNLLTEMAMGRCGKM